MYIYTISIVKMLIYSDIDGLMQVDLWLKCVSFTYFFYYRQTGANALTVEVLMGKLLLVD